MIQLVDKNESLIKSHFRDKNGSIIVKNDSEYTKTIMFKNKIDSMQEEIVRLNTLVHELIDKMSK